MHTHIYIHIHINIHMYAHMYVHIHINILTIYTHNIYSQYIFTIFTHTEFVCEFDSKFSVLKLSYNNNNNNNN